VAPKACPTSRATSRITFSGESGCDNARPTASSAVVSRSRSCTCVYRPALVRESASWPATAMARSTCQASKDVVRSVWSRIMTPITSS
jgi:hypothetical protein